MTTRRAHQYSPIVEWTGNLGTRTSAYKAYSRDHVIAVAGRPDIPGSSDPAFRGDASRHNPEDLLVASVSSCHMLWYLHLASEAGIVVTAYRDAPVGVMVEDRERGGWFERVAALARNWGSELADLGRVGHLNPASGFGDWAGADEFIARLSAAPATA